MLKDWKFGEFFLLLSQFFERIAYYSLAANLTIILLSDPLKWQNYNSLAAPFILNGFCFVSSMAGGILSDIFIRKTTTVIIGYLFYASYVGFSYVFWWDDRLPSICHNSSTVPTEIFYEKCSFIILPSVILSGIGSGLIRSVVVSMGVDMAIKKWEYPSTFFNLYYWCLNGGSLIAFLVVSVIQQNHSRRWGFAAPAIILALSFISFLLGGPFYIHNKKPIRSTLSLVFRIYLEACKKKFAMLCNSDKHEDSESHEVIIRNAHANSLFNDESEFENDNSDTFTNLSKPNHVENKNEYESYNSDRARSINHLSGVFLQSSQHSQTNQGEAVSERSFLDHCQVRFGGSFTETEVRDIQRFTFILGILFFMIPYYMVYFQIESTYMYQGMNMRLAYGSNGSTFNVPASWLIVINIILLIFLLPLLVKVIYPWLRARNIDLRLTTKIAMGFVFVFISISIAGGVETYRLYVRWFLKKVVYQKIDKTIYAAADMVVFYQVPQFLFMGVSEALTVVAGLELVCTQVPTSMHGLTNGLFWFSSGLGSFCGSGTLYLFNQINFKTYANCTQLYTNSIACRMDYYFFILAGFIVVAFLVFLMFLCRFRRLEKLESSQASMRRVSI